MPKRSPLPASVAPKAKATPQTLPKQFEAALGACSVEELRAYLRDLASRQRPIRADFLLHRATAGSGGGADRAAVLSSIRLGLKQPPKTVRRSWHDEPLTAAGKRVQRLSEIAETLLRTARAHLADHSDLPAVRATGLALLEAELTELPPAANWNSYAADLPHPAALDLLADLWTTFPSSEARELLWQELLTLPAIGPPDAPLLPALLDRLITLAPGHPDGPAAATRAVLAVTDALIGRQPAPPPAPKPRARPSFGYYEYTPQDRADSEIASVRLRLTSHLEKLLLLRFRLLAALEQWADLLPAVQPFLPEHPTLRTDAAKYLLVLRRPTDARALLQAGLNSLRPDDHSWRRTWQELLLKTEQAAPSSPAAARALAHRLLVEQNFRAPDALRALRGTYPPAEWPAARTALLTEAAGRFPRLTAADRARLLTELELDWCEAEANPARLVELLEAAPSAPLLLRYAQAAWPAHAERLGPLIEELLPEHLAAHNDRRQMEAAAQLMQRWARHQPATRIRLLALTATLRARFPRRTVLAEVLAAVGL